MLKVHTCDGVFAMFLVRQIHLTTLSTFVSLSHLLNDKEREKEQEGNESKVTL